MNEINVVIVDDEPDSISLLRLQLAKHCPWVNVLKTFSSPLQAADELPLIQPDLLFLDIEMPGMSGFELLEHISPLKCKVIFITAYNQYALQAFRFNALDYLVKPLETRDLSDALARYPAAQIPLPAQLSAAQAQSSGADLAKIAVATQAGVNFINPDDIIFAEASGNYSKLILSNGGSFVISKTLKDIQEMLEGKNFFRVHRQYIINLNKIKQFNRNAGLLTMENKTEIPVARIQKEKLCAKFNWL